ncbi:MAG: hypothetical protein HRT87_11545 [Legionellales bacterium]|nr:hypothetical protein [Legionellales bacterium]
MDENSDKISNLKDKIEQKILDLGNRKEDVIRLLDGKIESFEEHGQARKTQILSAINQFRENKDKINLEIDTYLVELKNLQEKIEDLQKDGKEETVVKNEIANIEASLVSLSDKINGINQDAYRPLCDQIMENFNCYNTMQMFNTVIAKKDLALYDANE